MAQPMKLLIFGDQTADVIPSIVELSAYSAKSHLLSRFFQDANDGIKAEISRLPHEEQELFLNFDSVAGLAEAFSQRDQVSVAVRTLLVCVVQVGRLLLFCESEPTALACSTNITIAGICTGSLAGLAAASVTCTEELLCIAPTIVQISLRLGLFAQARADTIEKSQESWALMISGMTEKELLVLVEDHAEQKSLSPDKRLYISSRAESSITISGPPMSLKSFVAYSLPESVNRSMLPLNAPFHASHLPIPNMSVMTELADSLTTTLSPHRSMVSTSNGKPYSSLTIHGMLNEAIQDVLVHPLDWHLFTAGILANVSGEAVLIPVGPTNAANHFQKAFTAAGIQCSTQKIQTTTKYLKSFPNDQQTNGDIAVVGMAGRFPGADTLEEFWNVLGDGLDLHQKVPKDRFNVDTHCDPSGKTQNAIRLNSILINCGDAATLTPFGVFLDNPGHFDARMFNMSPREAAQTCPMQRLLLITTYEALEMSGYQLDRTPSTSSERIGSFLGQTSDDWREVNASQRIDTFFITGGIRAFGPGRINYYFKWEGSSYSIDTACSSSAASIQLACSALLAREVDTAIAGGANILTASDLFSGLSRGGFLSPTGGCKTLDDAADGYCRGDAVGVVVLKRLQDAIADNDNILSVIKSVATNHSAHAVSITHPHSGTQQKLFRRVVAKSGLTPTDVDYVELHGTGTQAGDFTEFSSVTGVFANNRPLGCPLYIGSVKPNIGHGEAASGVTSLIKAILMLQQNTIPPHVGIKGKINHRLPSLEPMGVRLAKGKIKWPPLQDRKRRIVINNFDAAGGNTSMLIEDPPVRASSGSDPRTNHVVAISGRTPNSLKANRLRLLDFVKKNSVDLADLAYTTTARRQHHLYRVAHSCSTVHELLNILEKGVSEPREPQRVARGPIVFAFTGQGSHFSGMGHQLYNTNQFCRNLFTQYDSICVRQQLPSFLKLIAQNNYDYHSATPAETQLPIVAMEMVMASLWQSWGVSPDVVTGHSLGEYPALVVSGVVSLSDMFYLVGKRALMMEEKCSEGTHSMLAVKLSVDKALEILHSSPEPVCDIACINSPNTTVISGTKANIKTLQQTLKLRDHKANLLDVRFAFHSAQMDDILPSFSQIAESVQYRTPVVPFASPLRGLVVKEVGVINAQYLMEQCRQTVDFVQALHAVQSEIPGLEDSSWIDFGPQPFCLSMAQSTLGLNANNLVPTSEKVANIWVTISKGLSAVYNRGIDIRWGHFHKEYESSLRLLNLPSYAFDLKNYWLQYEGDWSLTKGQKDSAVPPGLDLSTFNPTSTIQRIESEVTTEDDITVVFASNLAESNLRAAIRGHLVNGVGLCPSSVYADMAMSAAKYVHTKLRPGEQGLAIEIADMEVTKPLLADPRDGVNQWLHITARVPQGSRDITVKYCSTENGRVVEHAHCIVKFGDGKQWMSNWSRNAYLIIGRIEKLVAGVDDGRTHKILRRMVYKLFSVLVAYGPKYQGLQKVYLDSDALEAAGFVAFQTTSTDDNFFFSPYWIDSLLHISGFVLNGSDTTPDDVVYISHGWKSFCAAKPLESTGQYKAYVRMQPTDARGVLAGDVYILDREIIVLICTGLKFQQIKRAILSRILPGAETASPRPIPHLERDTRHFDVAQRLQAPPKEARSLFDQVLLLIAKEAEISPAELVESAHLSELGVDSLLALGIVDKLRQMVGGTVPSSVFIDHPTVGKLRAFFDETSGKSTPQDDDGSNESDEYSNVPSPNSSVVSLTEESTCEKSSLPAVLKMILIDELGITESEIQPSTSFEEIGVDSLMTAVLINEVRRRTGENLASTFFLDNPVFSDVIQLEERKQKPISTLQNPVSARVSKPVKQQQQQRLRDVIDQSPKEMKPLKSTTVLLQGTPGSSPGLFFFPDGSGSASSYTALPFISGSNPVYGLNSPFVSRPLEFTSEQTIEYIASIYISAIREEQPRGPYVLAGWSIGGTYAYEVARQFLIAGESILGVILIDSPCPKVLPPMSLDTIDFLERIGIFSKLSKDGSSIPSNIRQHFHASIRALKAYTPQALPKTAKPIPCLAIWAREGVLERATPIVTGGLGNGQNETSDWLLLPRNGHGYMGWERLMSAVRISVVDGNHFTMMRQPAIKDLAKNIAIELERLFQDSL